jgi:hypothetical protein
MGQAARVSADVNKHWLIGHFGSPSTMIRGDS